MPCLPRKTLLGKVPNVPVFSDKIDYIDPDLWPEMIGETERRKHVRTIFNQGKVGSCAAEATSGIIMGQRLYGGQQNVVLNPYTQYWFTGNGDPNRGSSIDDNLQHSMQVGCLPEAVFPRSKGFVKPPDSLLRTVAPMFRADESFDIEDIVGVGSALLKDFFVQFGWKSHSCFLVELLSPTTALYANSWGATWNGNGFGTIKLAEINFRYGAFAIRSVVDSGEVDPEWVTSL